MGYKPKINKIAFAVGWVVLPLLFNSCIYPFAPTVPEASSFVVVNGDILIGKVSRISVSRSAGMDQNPTGKIRADAVYVEGSDGSVYHGVVQNDNQYLVDLSHASTEGKYRLVVEIGSAAYESEWSPVIVAPAIDSVSYSINDAQNVMTIDVSTHSSDSDNRYYRWLADQVWEYHAQDYAVAYYDPAADSIFLYEYGQNDSYFCWNSASVSDLMTASTEQMSENRLVRHALFNIDNTEQRVSYIYSVEICQESISERAYRHFSAVRSNSNNVGGLFSPQPAEARGNIVNRNDSSELVLGFISVTKPETKRIFIDCAALGFPAVVWNNPYNAETNPFRLPLSADWRSYYNRGYQVLEPVMDPNGNSVMAWLWIRSSCVRCMSQGGNKNRPDWWPNEHI